MSIATPYLMQIFVLIFIPLVLAEIAKKKFTYTLEDFFLQSRSMNSIMAFFTISATWISSYALLGSAGNYYSSGPANMISFAWSVLFGLLFYVLGKRIWFISRKASYITITDFFNDIYRNRLLSATVTTVLLAFSLPYLILQLHGGAFIIEKATQGVIPYAAAGLIFYLIIMIQLWSGGMRAIAMSDIYFTTMIIIAMLLTAVLFFRDAGSAAACFDAAATAGGEDFFKLGGIMEDNSVICWIALFFIVPFGVYMSPAMWAKTFAARDGEMFKKLPLVIAALSIIFLGPIFAGTSAKGAGIATSNPDNVFIVAIMNQNIPVAFAIFIFFGIAAASFSTSNSQIHSFAAIATMDIYRKHFNTQASDRQLVKVGRWFMLIISIFAYVVMLFHKASIAQMAIISLSGTTQLIVPVIGALFWRESNPYAAVYGIWAGEIIMMVLIIAADIPTAISGLIGFVINIVIFLAGSMLQKKDRFVMEKISRYMDDYRMAFLPPKF